MIKEFVEKWEERKNEIQEIYEKKHPEDYSEIVRNVITILHDDDAESPDPQKIHCIDDGDYQGTLLFVIPEDTYQPSTYWAVKVFYGSCSGCDTLEAIRESVLESPPTPEQTKDYMTLSLHVVQKLTKINGYGV